jgi:hypothetical protein
MIQILFTERSNKLFDADDQGRPRASALLVLVAGQLRR